MSWARKERLVVTAVVALWSCLLAQQAEAQATAPKLATEAELAQDVAKAPCADRKRLEAVRDLFLKMGAPADEISIDKYKAVSNLSVILAGSGNTREKIVIGAHYDKVIPGCGAIDNWSGVVILANLYQTFRNIAHEKDLEFVAFGREEQGLKGSRAMVRQLTDQEVEEHCAMLNLDSFGLSWPQVATNLSSDSLGELSSELAEKMDMQFSQQSVAGRSDSISFLDRGIPAMTLHGLGRNYNKIIHTHRDRAKQIQPVSLYLGYRLALALALETDQQACRAWR